MPEASESSLKRSRSRSPSEAETHSNKRANTNVSPRPGLNDDHPSRSDTPVPSSARTMNDKNSNNGSNKSKTDTDQDVTMTDSRTSKDGASSAEGDASVAASTSSNSGAAGSSTASAVPTAQIHLRCLIVTQDASIIIGKGGSHVNEIRDKSGARVMVSESIPGNPERILNVSGALDAVSKAFGLIVRRINDEPFDVPSVPGSRAVTIKFIIPNSRMGSVIGKAGSKIKEIQDASGAKLNASEGMLPGSTERVLSVSGVADAIHIATYYVGNILIEAGSFAPSTSNSSYRPSSHQSSRGPRSSTSHSPYGYSGNVGGGSSYVPNYGMPNIDASMPPQTQQIYIPNDLVGCIIGKGGNKINEIRSMSGSQIKIMEPGAQITGGVAAPNGERLVVITGQPTSVQMAVQLLYSRLEQERQKQIQGHHTGGTV